MRHGTKVIGKEYVQVYESHWFKAVRGSSQDEMESPPSALGVVLIPLTQNETAAYRAVTRASTLLLPLVGTNLWRLALNPA
jgi:hypothetical protein